MSKTKHTKELNQFKQRLSDDIEEGEALLQKLQPLRDPEKMPSVALHARAIQKTVETQKGLLGPLQKELPETIKAANTLLHEMDASQLAFKTALAGLSYHYGSDAPEVLEFVSPPNSYGYGREPEKRLRAHERFQEAFQRRRPEFDKGSRLLGDLEAVLQKHKSFEAAYKAHQKEVAESDQVVALAVLAIADFRKQKSLIRRALMLELDHPSDAYQYIPKEPRKTSSPTEPKEPKDPTEPKDPAPHAPQS
ncbi:hypothetical protein L6R29_24390 [Myxococcota bacterium]|nr:hypothetical protein [Myxococcota bacterium]